MSDGPTQEPEQKIDIPIALKEEDAAEIRNLRDSILRKKEAAEDISIQVMALNQRQQEIRSLYAQEADRMSQRLKLLAMANGLDVEKDPNWSFDYASSSFIRRGA